MLSHVIQLSLFWTSFNVLTGFISGEFVHLTVKQKVCNWKISALHEAAIQQKPGGSGTGLGSAFNMLSPRTAYIHCQFWLLGFGTLYLLSPHVIFCQSPWHLYAEQQQWEHVAESPYAVLYFICKPPSFVTLVLLNFILLTVTGVVYYLYNASMDAHFI